MFEWPLYLGLLLALAIGFWQGYRYGKKRHRKASLNINDQYFQGLNFLLNEEPDAAIDTFINALDVNSETLETHLALAKLLRKRGEVDRAIRIHQNLLARPGLARDQLQQAQYELATDFAKAGLLDRAEGLLTTLVDQEGPFQIPGLKRLLEVYQDEKEWQQGLQVLQRLGGSRFSKNFDQWAPIRAHFCCELAEQAIIKQNHDGARQWLRQALGFDKQNVRANLLSGRLEIATGNPQKGVAQLQKVAESHPDYLAELLPFLAEGFQQLQALPRYRNWLETVYQNHPMPAIACGLADVVAQLEGERAAAEFIAADVREHPSGMGLHQLLDYYLHFADGTTREHLASLQTVMRRIISRSANYQCRHCGFRGQKLHWLCPSCKHWGTIKPVRDVTNP